MSVKVVNSGPGVVKVSVETTPAIQVSSPEVSPVEVTAGLQGPKGDTGPQGIQGPPGADGAPGADGLGFTGGSYDSETGVVTFTSDDGLGFSTGDLRGEGAGGFATGGDVNQALLKNSATDYDTKWSPYAFPGADGDDGQVLTTDGAGTVSFAFPKTIAEVVKNVTAGTLLKGTPVHVTGNSGNEAEVVAADALIANAAYPAHFVLNEDIVAGGTGLGIALGFINNVDAAPGHGINPGDTIYLASGGGFTSTRPSGDTNAVQNLGVALKVNTSPTPNKISGVIMGAGRSNDVPNIATGKIWAGNASGVATATDTAYIDVANSRVGIGTTSPTEKLEVVGNLKMYRGTMTGDEGTIKLGVAGELWGAYDANSVALQKSGSNYQFLFGTQTGSFMVSDTTDQTNTRIELQPYDSTSSTKARVRVNSIGRLAYIQHSAIDNNYGNVLTWHNGNSASGTKGRVDVAGDIRVYDYSAGSGTGTERILLGDDGRAKILDSGDNTLIGSSWSSITTATNNVSIGTQSLDALTDGSRNVSVGGQSGSSLTSGARNVSIGVGANYSLTTQQYNVAIGDEAGYYSVPDNILGANTLVGTAAGKGASGTSVYRFATAMGYRAMIGLTSGDSNTAIGAESGYNLTSGGTNTALGRRSFYYNTTGNSNVAIGYQAAYGQNGLSTFSNTIAIGFSALAALTTGVNNVAIGHQAALGLTNTNSNTAVGYQAMLQGSPVNSVAIGQSALRGGGATTPSRCVAIGVNALYDITTAQKNVAVGFNSQGNITTGSQNTAIGDESLGGATTSVNNVVVGYGVLQAGGDGGYNTVVGSQSMWANTGGQNVMVGYRAGYGTGSIATTSYSNNVGIGYRALNVQTTGSNNVAVGHDAGLLLTTGGNNVLLGYQAGGQLTTESNKLYIHNSNTATPLIYGEFDNTIVRVNGQLQVGDPSTTGFKLPTVDGTANYVLQTDGSGTVSWAAMSGGGAANMSQSFTAPATVGEFQDGARLVTGAYGTAPAATAGTLVSFANTNVAAVGAQSAATAATGMLTVVTDAASGDELLVEGVVKMSSNTGWSTAKKGAPLYMSTTAGQVTTTAPSTAGEFVRVVGHVVDSSNSTIYFKPDNTWLEL